MTKHSFRFVNRALGGTAFALTMLLGAAGPADAQVSVGISTPSVDIGINMPVYPELVQVPDYPVYYAPGAQSNYFFYDGMYWAYERDNWHASAWYNGPWTVVTPQAVPLFVLRVPVSYYRNPPLYFRGWRADAPPRWGDHWGNEWARQRVGWDRWDRHAAPAPAPLPLYQRQYFGARYPQPAQQRELLVRNYRYQPREIIVRQHLAAIGGAPDRAGRPANQAGAQREPNARPAHPQPASEHPGKERPAREHPANDRPAKERPAKERPATELPAKEHPAKERPAKEHPAKERPARERPAQQPQQALPHAPGGAERKAPPAARAPASAGHGAKQDKGNK